MLQEKWSKDSKIEDGKGFGKSGLKLVTPKRAKASGEIVQRSQTF